MVVLFVGEEHELKCQMGNRLGGDIGDLLRDLGDDLSIRMIDVMSVGIGAIMLAIVTDIDVVEDAGTYIFTSYLNSLKSFFFLDLWLQLYIFF